MKSEIGNLPFGIVNYSGKSLDVLFSRHDSEQSCICEFLQQAIVNKCIDLLEIASETGGNAIEAIYGHFSDNQFALQTIDCLIQNNSLN